MLKNIAGKTLLLILLISLSSFPLYASQEKEGLKDLARVKVKASFNIKAGEITGKAVIELPSQKATLINLSGLNVKKISLSGKAIKPELENGHFRVFNTKAKQILEISFSGRFVSLPNVISPKAVLLTGNWFPSVEGLAYYDLHVFLPKNFKAIAPADQIRVKHKKEAYYHFIFEHPQEAPPLVAAPFHLYEEKSGNITYAVYLLKKDDKLAQAYLKKSQEVIKEYQKLLGPYPYQRFAVVENYYQTGYAYPTFTLIGGRLLGLPFIREISLVHEILHNWFGNGVYVDWEQGNWCEGLVTYLADHRIAAKKGEGALYRHRLLVNYESYVTPEKDFPLKDFRGRYDRASQAIGYGKGALFFHMLRKRLGDDDFFDSLKQFCAKNLFSYASWDDLKDAFEKESNTNLDSFFKQWLKRAGLPRINLISERTIPLKKDTYLVGLSLTQELPYYELRLPLKVVSDREEKKIMVHLSGPRTRVDVEIKGKPQFAILDEDYDLARHLHEKEFPPVIARLLGQEGYLSLASEEKKSLYEPLVSFFEKRGYRLEKRLISPEEVSQNILYLGKVPSKIKNLFPKGSGNFCLMTRENPLKPKKVMGLVKTNSSQEIKAVLPKLEHLGRYQGICASKGKIIQKIEPKFERGIRVKLSHDVRGISLNDLYSLETVARAVSLNKVIFLGERHDRYEEHLAQLEIIKWLNENGHKIAIGLEMFQRPFQKWLDDYISGKIDEEEFLRGTEYFKRWGFNWKLYKPIIDYAREHRIPLVALNMRAEITNKIAKGGLESLSPKEKALIPEIDRSNLAYREFLRFVFESHQNQQNEIKDFDSFFEAQLVWDETMASSIVSYLKLHPDRQMVVIVGRGHVVYGYGIPSRIARRGISDYAIVLMGPDEYLAPGMGDYVLFPQPVKPPFEAKLGVLVEETKEGLKVRKVFPGTPAEKGGLKEKDIIIQADGKPIKNLADLKIILSTKNPGDKIKLVIKRNNKQKVLELEIFPAKRTSPHRNPHKK